MDHAEPLDLILRDEEDQGQDRPVVVANTAAVTSPAVVYLAALSPSSRRAMRAALNRLAGELAGWVGEGRRREPRVPFDAVPWHQLRFEHVGVLRARLAEHYSPSAANQSLTALRETLKNCWRLGLIDADTFAKVTDFKAVRGERLPRGRVLTQGEFLGLVQACTRGARTIGARDLAVLAIGYVAGLRRSEIVGADLADWCADTGELKVRRGKGNKGRVVFVRNGASEAIADWIAARGDADGPLVLPVTRHGTIVHERLSSQAVFELCRRRAVEAGIAPFAPHDLRRSCASDMLDAGEDLSVVQKHLGHANVQTTVRYDRRGHEALKKASSRLCFPYRRGARR